MQRDERDRLVQAIGDVSGRWREMDWQEFDDAISGILEPALTATGFVLRERKPPGSQDDGFDVFGVRDPDPYRSACEEKGKQFVARARGCLLLNSSTLLTPTAGLS